MSLKYLSLAMLPSEIDSLETEAYLVIDVLRATTSIVALFESGLSNLLIVNNVNEARVRAKKERRILFGEVGGLPPQDFNYGNSPSEISTLKLDNQKAALVTTNGTRALCLASKKGVTAAGALSNISSAIQWAGQFTSLSIICSGESSGNRFALEDFAVAARYIHKMAREYSPLELNDGARLAIELGNYEGWIASSLTSDLTPSSRLITGTTHGQELAKLGFSADLQFCTTENTSSLVPYVVTADENSALLKVSENQNPSKSF